MRLIAFTAMTLLAACATQAEPESYWRDVSGNGRGQTTFDADRAQCEYEIAQQGQPFIPVGRPQHQIASAMLSGPPPGQYDRCMRAKGWARVG